MHGHRIFPVPVVIVVVYEIGIVLLIEMATKNYDDEIRIQD